MRTLVETEALVGRARRLPPGEARRTHARCPATVQAILAARIDRLAARGQAAAPGRRGHRQGRAVRAARRRSPSVPEDAPAPGPRPPPGRRVPLRDEPLPGPRVHLQARAHPRGGLRQPAPGATARAPRPDRRGHRARSIPTASPSTSSGSPTTPCAAKRGRRRCAYLRQAGVKAAGALGATARRSAASSRRWRPSRVSPRRRGRAGAGASTSGSTCGTRSTPLGETRSAFCAELLAADPIAERLQDRWRQVHVSSTAREYLVGPFR